MSERIIFYLLRQKYVNQRTDIPETARQVIYYTLAVGHHVGVMDCFSSLIEVPLQDFKNWLQQAPPGAGRSKLEGVLKWGEIEINSSHRAILKQLFENSSKESPDWTRQFEVCLEDMAREPALYLMLRRTA